MRVPEFMRIVTRTLLWTGLCLFLIINMITMTMSQYSPVPALAASLVRPFSVQSHLKAAQILETQGYLTQAKRELMIARDLFTDNTTVLGETTDLTDVLKHMEQEPARVSQLYEYWKSVVIEKPDYRDGLMMAGLYAYRLGHQNDALEFLEKAHALDASFAPVNNLLDLIKK